VNRTQKSEEINSLNQVFKDSELVVITRNNGITVADITSFRKKLYGVGANLKVVKNRLARIALKGTKYEQLSEVFVQPTLIAYAKDPLAVAKLTVEFAKNNEKMVIIGGAMGDKKLDMNALNALAAIPSMNELRAQIAGMLKSPAGKVARVLKAYAEKDQAA